MSLKTKILGLFKYDPDKDGASTFNIKQALNDNWDKLDNEVAARVKTTELAAEVKKTVKGGSLTASDLGAVSAADKGKAGGIAGLGADGKVPASQLPAMNYEGKGAVDTHNKSTTAHKTLFDKKLDKLTGKKGQFAGFTEDNVVGAMDAPNGGESDSGVGELQDTEMEVGTITNAGAGWNTYHFREAFEGVPQVSCQAEDFDGVVLVKDITAEKFLYCLRKLQTGSYYTGDSTGTNPSHSAATLVNGTTTTADAVKINYIAVEYGGER
nr:MAG TPA: hypothetical protein [Caudoviricetes sp.]